MFALPTLSRRKPASARISRPHPIAETTSSRITGVTRASLSSPSPLFIADDALTLVMSTVGSQPAETGGMLGGVYGSNFVDHFYFDRGDARTRSTYSPTTETINGLLRDDWNPRQIRLLGCVHSHPDGATSPSHGDLIYAERILGAIPSLDRLLLPIVQSAADVDQPSLHGFAARRDGSHVRIDHLRVVVAESDRRPRHHPAFQRVESAYELDAMSRSRVVAVGTGGSAGFLEDMARCGVGEFVLIDPDVVSSTNIATQQTYLKDVGRAKVEALAERIVAVSPWARVWTFAGSLDDLDDVSMRRLCLSPLDERTARPPKATLLCGFTDSFDAQARVNRLALDMGVAHLGGAVYREGRGVEITFSAPGVTRACSRCALGGRYRAYLEQGYQPDVTSHGTPFWATARLNALKQPLALALLHRSAGAHPDHPATARYARLLAVIGARNLVQVSNDPDIATGLGLGAFADVQGGDPRGRLPFDTTLWLAQEPESPDQGYAPCPDCGGSGDLRTSMATFVDTRPMTLTFGDHRR